MRHYTILAVVLALLSTACQRHTASASSEASETAESAADTLSTPYLTWHQLRGPVSDCVTEMSGAYMEGAAAMPADEGATTDSVAFSPEGRILYWQSAQQFADGVHIRFCLHFAYDSDGQPAPGTDTSIDPAMALHLTLNAYGEPVEMAVSPDEGDFDAASSFAETYEWIGSRPVRTELRADEIVRRTRFIFDATSSLPAGARIETDDIEDRQTAEETYVYTEFDAYGNWTRRDVTIRTSARRYDSSEQSDSEVISTITHRTDTRRITYRKS